MTGSAAEGLKPAKKLPDLPSRLTFEQMADELQQCARRETFSLEALNHFALRDSTGIGLSTIAQVQRQSAAFHDMSVLLRALAPHEEIIREIAMKSDESE